MPTHPLPLIVRTDPDCQEAARTTTKVMRCMHLMKCPMLLSSSVGLRLTAWWSHEFLALFSTYEADE